MPQYRILEEETLAGKRVLLRAGFDVPIEGGVVLDTERIEAMLPTIRHILKAGASLVIMAHQGRPKGKADPVHTQKPITAVLERLLKKDVAFAASPVGVETQMMAKALKPGDVLLLENLRYHPGEEKNDPAFAADLALLGDIYVNDAFTNCHRNHASMVGIAKLLPSYMGLNLGNEIAHLSKVLDDPRRPLVLIISGAKIETKIPIIEQFLCTADDILLGGCIANTFIAARGCDVGRSKYEESFIPKARELMLEANNIEHADIHVPRDAVVSSSSDFSERADLPVENIEGDMAIFDIGAVTTKRYIEAIAKAGMILWNGPLGFYEKELFAEGTKNIAHAIAKATAMGAVSIIGGGDTIDFHRRYAFNLDAYTFVSTGGGAMLEYIAGKRLPALTVLETK